MTSTQITTTGSEPDLDFLVAKHMQIHGSLKISRNKGCLQGCSQANHLIFFLNFPNFHGYVIKVNIDEN